MGTIPGYSRDAVFAAKVDAQLAVHGKEYEYVPVKGPNGTLLACEGEGAQEGSRVYFYLFAKPGSITPVKGDKVLLDDRRWYTVVNHEVSGGWLKIRLHLKGVV